MNKELFKEFLTPKLRINRHKVYNLLAALQVAIYIINLIFVGIFMKNSILLKLRDRNEKAQGASSIDIFLPYTFDCMKYIDLNHPEVKIRMVESKLNQVEHMIMCEIGLNIYFMRSRDAIVEYCVAYGIDINHLLNDFDGYGRTIITSRHVLIERYEQLIRILYYIAKQGESHLDMIDQYAEFNNSFSFQILSLRINEDYAEWLVMHKNNEQQRNRNYYLGVLNFLYAINTRGEELTQKAFTQGNLLKSVELKEVVQGVHNAMKFKQQNLFGWNLDFLKLCLNQLVDFTEEVVLELQCVKNTSTIQASMKKFSIQVIKGRVMACYGDQEQEIKRKGRAKSIAKAFAQKAEYSLAELRDKVDTKDTFKGLLEGVKSFHRFTRTSFGLNDVLEISKDENVPNAQKKIWKREKYR